MFIALYQRTVPRGREMASRLVAIAIALSFIATVLPIAVASANNANAMSCCVGKAGHCHSGIPAQPPAPKLEPMCGRDSADLEDDEITIVAEPSTNESQHSHSQTVESNSSHPAAKSASLSQPCKMDCGACTSAASRQQKRERVIAHARLRHASQSGRISYTENSSHSFSSNEEWSRINPRGPPAGL
jgi:hypothetical protein